VLVSGPLYLAWRYLLHHRVKSAILITAITLIIYLPLGLNVLIGQSASELTARAEATPLLVGEKGSALELVLSSLYFESTPPASTHYAEALKIAASGLADPIPLYVRFRASGYPIVGTTLEYLDHRGSRLRSGRRMALLGECVVGARVARALGLEVGSKLVSSPETVFDLAGTYPLEMDVVGILAASRTADDLAVFVDVKTAWIIAGLGHGHQDLASPEAESRVMAREGNRITANASVVEYNQIDTENIDSFHFHGELGGLPLTSVLAVPHDEKSRVLLMGRYEDPSRRVQVVRPLAVMAELLETVLTVQSYLVAAIAIVASGTLATSGLVFLLSLRLRHREIETMVKIGGARRSIALLVVSEIVVVLVVSVALAGLLALGTSLFGSAAIRAILLA
jgi:putative ABC transport system permease protein